MITTWLSKSFNRQITVMLLLVGISSSTLYAGLAFFQEYGHYKNFMQQQALQLSNTLSQTLEQDVHYKNYYSMWEKIHKTYDSNRFTHNNYKLIIVKEIAIVNGDGKLLAHTQPQTHKLNSNYSHPLLQNIDFKNETTSFTWFEKERTLLVYSSIMLNNNINAYMLISYDTSPLILMRDRATKSYLITQFIIISLTIFIALFFTKKLSSPLKILVEHVSSIGNGNLNIKELHHRQDEFKSLALTLEKADKNIYESHQKVIEQQKTMSSILNNSEAMIYMKSINGQYLLINKRYSDIFHIKQDDIIGKNDFDVFSKKVAKQIVKNDAIVLNNKNSLHFEETMELDDGEHTYISVKFPILNSHGEITAICGISTDITPRKKIENELREYKNKLETTVEERTAELNETIKEMEAFSYSVSHDLRSPLRSINGFSIALQEDYLEQFDENGKDYLTRIIRATERMADIIDDLLLLSRVSRQEICKQKINLSQVANNVIKQLQDLQPSRNIDIEIQANVYAQADAKLILLALENILGNAWKYTNKKSTAKIYFGQTNIQGENTYFVKDNGAGFDMQYAGKLFKAFQRLHGNDYEGTGIGLATVSRIIHRHQGEIWAESTVDEGATFYFTLS